jgi:predicted nuclease of predicted toxin-antitoxin system
VTQFDLVADEHIALSTINALRELGYGVTAVAATMPGAMDQVVLHHACSINAVLLTFDRDYGELIFRRGLPPPRSVLYLRTIPTSPIEMTDIIKGLLNGRLAGDVSGYFVVWTRDGVRKRAFPPPG